ncbi:hypothetical protein HER21_28635 [Pseudomonas sp. BGM005]|nr:hypothetical protein [Pseudomonas sp. BG5]
MQQGSDVSTLTPHSNTQAGGVIAIQRRRVVAIKEVHALAGTMQTAAQYCIDQGHVTVETMEQMADLLGLMRRQLDALRLDLSN